MPPGKSRRPAAQSYSNDGWGTDLFAEHPSTEGEVPTHTGTFGESMLDMARSLFRSGAGTNEDWAGTGDQREYSSLDAAGFGLGFGNDIAGVGSGLGAGWGQWSSNFANPDTGQTRSSEGYSGSLGGVVRGDQNFSAFGENLSTEAEVYRGIGGNAYSFDEGAWTDRWGNEHSASHGYGVDGTYAPVGVNNAAIDYDGVLGQSGVSVENAVYGQMSGSMEGGVSDDGTMFGRASWAPGRTEVHGLEGYSSNFFGDTNYSMESFGTGPRWQSNFEANPDGSFGGGAQWAGGGWAVNNAQLNHDFGHGVTLDASAGEINTANSWAFDGGWDASTQTFGGTGDWSTGNTVRDANVDLGLPGGGGAGVHVGEYLDGNHISGDMSVGPDGLHAQGDAQIGGFELNNSSMHAGWEGMYYNEIGADSISNRTLVEGGNLDINGDGLDASVDSVRAGGWRVNGVNGRQDMLGTRTDYSLGEFSNDVLVEGADLQLGPDGMHAGVDNLDFGGIRLKDWQSHSDLGEAGTLDTQLGKFTNGNTLTNANVDLTGDGLDASFEELSALGMDIENAGFDYEGPGGAHANAHLGGFHTGLNVQGFDGHMGLDGVDLNAESASWDTYRMSDFNMSTGIPGLVENELSLGSGNFNSFAGENLHAGLDENGLALSGDNLAYSYLGLEDLHASNEYFGGVLGNELDLGRGSALSGSADHLDYRSDIESTDLTVEGLNAHGLQLEDLQASEHIGDLNAGVGLGNGSLLDLNVGQADLHTSNFGTTGNASVEDANLDLINLDDASFNLGWGEQTLLGGQADFNSSAGVDSASGDWDLMSGTASGEFENAHYGQQLSDASVNLFGTEFALPDAGYDLNATGGGDVDLTRGAANGNLSLAGSSVNLAGYEMELGDWAQASGGVDLSQGAVNANLGGDNGVGVNASLAEGNLDLNLFGHEIDVDEGIGEAVDWVGDTASGAWDTVTSWMPSISLW